MKYSFITIEGNIGAGKTTLAHLLSKHFASIVLLRIMLAGVFFIIALIGALVIQFSWPMIQMLLPLLPRQ